MYFKITIFASFVTLAIAIPLEKQEILSAHSYVTSNLGYADVGSEESGLGEDFVHLPQSIVTKHEIPTYVHKYVTPVVKHVPVVVKHEEEKEEEHAPAKYEFYYAVEDKHTGDVKSQKEVRDGDIVKGEYSLKEADGTTRTVKYSADKKSGFNAVVIRSGHAVHPQVEAKKVVEVKKVAVPVVLHQLHEDDHHYLSSHF